MSAKYRRALALTSVLVISTSILTPPVCPTPTPWSVSAAHAAPPGATPPGNLTMNASLDRSGTVQVKGTLRTHTKQPVSGALINLAVDGKPLAVGVTHDNGSWSGTFRLPPTMQAGAHELSATFDGTEGVGAASASGTFSIAAQPTVLTAAVKPTIAAPGALLNVNGTVTLPTHRRVTDSHVAILLGTDGQTALTHRLPGQLSSHVPGAAGCPKRPTHGHGQIGRFPVWSFATGGNGAGEVSQPDSYSNTHPLPYANQRDAHPVVTQHPGRHS